MKVLVVHNRYRTSAPSGEDIAVRNECDMLRSHGIEVATFDRCNDDVDDSTLIARALMAANTVWSRGSRAELSRLLARVRPDLVHVHNTFSVLSPSIYGACAAAGVPVVQTLHNFRLFCPSAMFLRDGRPCEDCVDRSLWQSIRHRCYRQSLGATATLAGMLTLHRAMGTYARHVSRFIALTGFAKEKVIKGGLDARKVVVKPNFIPAPPPPGRGDGGYVVFVGRLLQGKGTKTLLQAWRGLSDIPLRIIGDGAMRAELEEIAARDRLNVGFMGNSSRDTVLETVAAAAMLVVPSEWYEGFPMVIAESFACGTPVLASRIGSLRELVEDGVTGRHFTAGDPQELSDGVRSLLRDRESLANMRLNARQYFESRLTERQNCAELIGIYNQVLSERREVCPA